MLPFFLSIAVVTTLVFPHQTTFRIEGTQSVTRETTLEKSPTISVDEFSLPWATTEDEGVSRGPVMASGESGNLILFGGIGGGEVFFETKAQSGVFVRLGNIYDYVDRPTFDYLKTNFTVLDVEILQETSQATTLAVSLPVFDAGDNCVNVGVLTITASLDPPKLRPGRDRLLVEPCSPLSDVQPAGGRLVMSDRYGLLLATGEMGLQDEALLTSPESQLTSLLAVDLAHSKLTPIARGLRNPQGLLALPSGEILISDHGPRGGDELNVFRDPGSHFGWPHVSLGSKYSAQSKFPIVSNTHEGYSEPEISWGKLVEPGVWTENFPPSEIAILPRNTKRWREFSGSILVGGLRRQSLVVVEKGDGDRMVETGRVLLGEEVRHMLYKSKAGGLIISTDSGLLLKIRTGFPTALDQ